MEQIWFQEMQKNIFEFNKIYDYLGYVDIAYCNSCTNTFSNFKKYKIK